jgi:hypothetical protein
MSCRDPHIAVAVSNSPVPVDIQCGFSLLGSLITVISGLGMLKRKNWARLLYLIWTGISQMIILVASPDKLNAVPGAILFALIALFLLLPTTAAAFQNKPE